MYLCIFTLGQFVVNSGSLRTVYTKRTTFYQFPLPTLCILSYHILFNAVPLRSWLAIIFNCLYKKGVLSWLVLKYAKNTKRSWHDIKKNYCVTQKSSLFATLKCSMILLSHLRFILNTFFRHKHFRYRRNGHNYWVTLTMGTGNRIIERPAR